MLALFIFGLIGAALVLVGAPVVLFGLMLETCNERASVVTAEPAPGSLRLVPGGDLPRSRRFAQVAA